MEYALLVIIAIGIGANIFFTRKKPAEKESSPAPQSLVACVMCGGTLTISPKKYNYDGVGDCKEASALFEGDKECTCGCLGMGSCVRVCPEGAIHIIDGVAAVDRKICNGCGLCAEICPKNVIHMLPKNAYYWVGCNIKGQKENSCAIGCDGCGVCVDECPALAMKMQDGRAKIDYTLCKACGKCYDVCPRKTIWKM